MKVWKSQAVRPLVSLKDGAAEHGYGMAVTVLAYGKGGYSAATFE